MNFFKKIINFEQKQPSYTLHATTTFATPQKKQDSYKQGDICELCKKAFKKYSNTLRTPSPPHTPKPRTSKCLFGPLLNNTVELLPDLDSTSMSTGRCSTPHSDTQ